VSAYGTKLTRNDCDLESAFGGVRFVHLLPRNLTRGAAAFVAEPTASLYLPPPL
jgi:hypothetical protein